MNFDFPVVSKIMVLAPHPDDEALGCSGTILKLNKSGVSSSLVFLTDGECLNGAPSTDIAAKRKKEAEMCTDLLGSKDVLFLNFPDGNVSGCFDEIYSALYGIINEKRPDIIFSPSIVDYHEDHIATSRIALKLLNTMNSFKLAFYEIYSTVRFNYLIDITEFAEQKKRVILNYHTSLCGKPEIYVNAALGLNAQRSIFMQKGGYYEAFYVLERPLELESIYDYLLYKDFSR